MAGSDKKEQRLDAGKSTAGGNVPFVVQDPDVSHIVIDATGLILRKTLDTDQTITINTWSGSLPTNPDYTEYFRLQIARANSNEWTLVGTEHTYVGGATWVPLVFTLTSAWFLEPENEGGFDLRYEHQNYNETQDHSGRVRIFIDKIPPNGATPPSKMVFTFTPPITDATFGTDDFLEATIPNWTGDAVGTHVAFAWLKDELPEDPEEIVFIGPVPILGGGKVQIPKVKFIEAGDGLCCGGYVLIDKAGNISGLSRYELISVALDVLPLPPLSKPTVLDPTPADGELRREDIIDGVLKVHLDHVNNGKNTDIVVVEWEGRKIEPGTPLGANPSGGFEILVPWNMILQAYGNAKGPVDTKVSYTVFRGVEPFPSVVETIKCNLSIPGPVNPNPEPGNPNLEVVNIVGKSDDPNKLIDTDEDEDVFAKIKLVTPLEDGDTYQVMWNGTPIGDPRVIDLTDDEVGDTIEIPLDWDIIRGEGPDIAMPVWYVLTHADHANPQEPKLCTPVDIQFLVLKLPPAEPLHPSSVGNLNCNSLRWNAGGTEYGFEYRIPPSAHLKPGDDVEVVWNAYKDFNDPSTIISDAQKKHTFTDITDDQAQNGIVWLIEPYATHILPIFDEDNVIDWGKGNVTYTITGKPAASLPPNTKVGLNQGEGSCNIPTKP
ncbi:hypothetical protein [Pseudomonas sp. Irchel s3f7]|uniref:hypothetical protein n=1 Tax=Pseudomonas sp. Irchel s3f7 TaxID=2009153 RepID=UPI000BA412C7|nr:hypothetical protein [Pseudomonas sp. Irchel s3f7]